MVGFRLISFLKKVIFRLEKISCTLFSEGLCLLKVAKREADKENSKEASNMVWTTTEKEQSL